MSHFFTYPKMLCPIIKQKIVVLKNHAIYSWNSKQIKKRWHVALLYSSTSEISWLWAVSSGKKGDYWNVYKFLFMFH